MITRTLLPNDDLDLAEIIRTNLKAHALDIPGTVYFDDNLNHLSGYYGESDMREYFILEEDGKILGGVGFAEFSKPDGIAELQKLYLTNEVKGRGLGRYLVELVIEKAKEAGYKKLYLETHTNLQTALIVYEKCGFIEIEKPDSVNHSTMNKFYIMDLQ